MALGALSRRLWCPRDSRSSRAFSARAKLGVAAGRTRRRIAQDAGEGGDASDPDPLQRFGGLGEDVQPGERYAALLAGVHRTVGALDPDQDVLDEAQLARRVGDRTGVGLIEDGDGLRAVRQHLGQRTARDLDEVAHVAGTSSGGPQGAGLGQVDGGGARDVPGDGPDQLGVAAELLDDEPEPDAEPLRLGRQQRGVLLDGVQVHDIGVGRDRAVPVEGGRGVDEPGVTGDQGVEKHGQWSFWSSRAASELRRMPMTRSAPYSHRIDAHGPVGQLGGVVQGGAGHAVEERGDLVTGVGADGVRGRSETGRHGGQLAGDGAVQTDEETAVLGVGDAHLRDALHLSGRQPFRDLGTDAGLHGPHDGDVGEGAQGVERLVALDLPAARVVVPPDVRDEIPGPDDHADTLRPVQLEQGEAGGVGAQLDPGGRGAHDRVVVVDDRADPGRPAGREDLGRVVGVREPLPGVLDVRPPEPPGREGLLESRGVVEVHLDGPHADAPQGDLGRAVDRGAVDEQRVTGPDGGVEGGPDRTRAGCPARRRRPRLRRSPRGRPRRARWCAGGPGRGPRRLSAEKS